MKSCECGCKTPIASNRRFVLGHNSRVENGFYGRTHTAATKEKISNSRKGKLLGEQHHNWKGDAAGYLALHVWVRRHRPPTCVCALCGAEGYTEYANISGVYLRDLEDYVEVCVPCHRELDDEEWYEKITVH